jgi:alanine dehydrogenase
MHIAVPAETSPGELRVAITPDSVARLVKAGHVVRVQAGAGRRAGFPDTAYESVGATIAEGNAVYEAAELVCRVQPPLRCSRFSSRDGTASCSTPSRATE